jgi:hypothetical protein
VKLLLYKFYFNLKCYNVPCNEDGRWWRGDHKMRKCQGLGEALGCEKIQGIGFVEGSGILNMVMIM